MIGQFLAEVVKRSIGQLLLKALKLRLKKKMRQLNFPEDMIQWLLNVLDFIYRGL